MTLDESEGRVSERRCNHEGLEPARGGVADLDVVDGGAPAGLEQGKQPVDVVNLEDDAADAVGMLL